MPTSDIATVYLNLSSVAVRAAPGYNIYTWCLDIHSSRAPRHFARQAQQLFRPNIQPRGPLDAYAYAYTHVTHELRPGRPSLALLVHRHYAMIIWAAQLLHLHSSHAP